MKSCGRLAEKFCLVQLLALGSEFLKLPTKRRGLRTSAPHRQYIGESGSLETTSAAFLEAV